MAARESGGLSDLQVERLREQLAAGSKPRVRVAGPQFADQPTGTVLAVGRPETDGEDFVTVRVKVGGVTDALRFSPRELAASRSATKKAAPAKKAPVDSPAAPAKRAAPAEDARDAQHAAPAKKASPGKRAPATRQAQGHGAGSAPLHAGAAAANRRRGAALPTVSVTLTSAGVTWAVSAHRGSRAVVKNAPVPPGVVSAVAELLGLPAVADAVAAVNDAALQEAEARAAALRAELAALETELDSHRRP